MGHADLHFPVYAGKIADHQKFLRSRFLFSRFSDKGKLTVFMVDAVHPLEAGRLIVILIQRRVRQIKTVQFLYHILEFLMSLLLQ